MKTLAVFVALIVIEPVFAQGHRLDLYAVDGLPRYSHTWVVIDNRHTISWMPASLKIHPWRLRPEPGVNLSFHETMRWAQGRAKYVGSRAISEAEYQQYMIQLARLNSGRVAYKAIDLRTAPYAINCVRAAGAGMHPGLAYGTPAGRMILQNRR